MIRFANLRTTALAALAVVIAFGWFAYAPGQGGDFLLDDMGNLDGLNEADAGEAALQFVFSGVAGPLGRPLTLLTFLPQADQIESGARAFLTVNILLHLFNTCLVAGLLYALSIARKVNERTALLVAISATAIWLFMPLLASTSLMVVQRMTSLSATFVLLGLSGYLVARLSLDRSPGRSLLGMSTSLTLGTVLAVLSKENGILLPTLALVLEATVLRRPQSVSAAAWRRWTVVFLMLPTLVLVGYLVTAIPYSETLVLRRDFGAWERLLTQSRILWEYLFNAFVPRPGIFGPFHDGYPVARQLLDPVTFLAFSGWLATLAAAVVWRRRYPLFALAVLWFIGGHLLESTVLALELYFEHRNYVPIIGPVYALCAAAAGAAASTRRLLYAGAPLYVLVNAIVLFGLTSLWGNPPLAAHYWEQKFPDSIRAKTTAASYPLSDDWVQKTLATLHRVSENRPEAGYLRIQELDLACVVTPEEDHGDTVDELESLLQNVGFTYTAGTMLSNLITTVNRVDCNSVDNDAVRRLARALATNPRYESDPLYKQMHEQLLARMANHEGKLDQVIRHLEKASGYKATADLNRILVGSYLDAGRFADARRYIKQARDDAPWQPFQRYVWLNRLDRLERLADEIESEQPASASVSGR